VFGIIENMSYFNCPHCGQRSDIFSHGGARREAERLGVEFLGEIPLDMAIRETSDGGQPIVVSQPGSPHAAAYRAIAERVWQLVLAVQGDARRQAPRIVVQ
jgi:ATP-binding protein involved in chromosome partitioning